MFRHSPQSPAGSVSSCSTSPIPLHTSWAQSNNTNNNTSFNHLNNKDNSNNNSDNQMADDDIFGSAAWRKKRGTKRNGGKTKLPDNGSDLDSPNHSKGRAVKRWALVCFLRTGVHLLTRWGGVVREWVGSVWVSVVSSSTSDKEPESLRGDCCGRDQPTMPTTSTVPEPGSYELTSEALVQQARLLCGDYIYHRLSSKGLMSKRVHVAPHPTLVSEELCSAGQELERLYPKVYTDVSRRIAMTMSSAQLVRRMLTSVLEGTFKGGGRGGVTWAKVVSMVVISAAFAEECVVQGHPNFVEDVVMCVGHFVLLNLSGWLVKQGGWSAFPTSRPPMLVHPSPKTSSLYRGLVLLFAAILLMYLLRLCFGTT